MIWNARVPHGAQEDRIEWPQLLDTVCGHHLSALSVSFATPIERVPVESESKALSCRFQHSNAFRHDFFSDAITCDDRDIKGFHQPTSIPSTLTPIPKPRSYPTPNLYPSRNH